MVIHQKYYENIWQDYINKGIMLVAYSIS